MNICIITDNDFIYSQFSEIVKDSGDNYDFYYSAFNKSFVERYGESPFFKPIRLKDMDDRFFSKYDLFISLHCKQLFPDELVNNYRCINVHPGLNPFNRGWFPQVFSILNKKPVGVTIHEMDRELDHGPIIFQEEIPIYSYDTSQDVYQRIQDNEIEMIREHLEEIVNREYTARKMESEGNTNYKEDFDRLCKINLNKEGTFGEFIDLLRATTFAKYDNAYFVDEDGNKVFVSINLKKDNIVQQ